MQKLELNVNFADVSDKEELAEIADQIQTALADETDVNDPAAVPITSGRGVAEVVALVAVALTVASDVDKGLKAVESIFARFKKLFAKSEKKSEQVLAGLKASDILINVDGVLVPMDKLSEDHLKFLRKG